MPDGKLILSVVDVLGDPVVDKVDVLLTNQTLSESRTLRNLDLRQTVELTGLNIFPNGRYRLEIDAPSYHAVSRFIDIPPGGSREVMITLPVNPKKVIKVQFPEFEAAAVPKDARDLLTRTGNLLNFPGQTGEALYGALDDIRKAGFLNLVAKANRTVFQSSGRTVLSFIQELSELRGDRFFAFAPMDLRSETINSLHTELFHEVSEALHTPPPGFLRDRSFKTLDTHGNLQLSFFSSPDGRVAVDMDIDDAQGFDHVFQVVGNFFGGPTHPYNIHEVLIASQECDPGYRFVLHAVSAMTA